MIKKNQIVIVVNEVDNFSHLRLHLSPIFHDQLGVLGSNPLGNATILFSPSTSSHYRLSALPSAARRASIGKDRSSSKFFIGASKMPAMR